MLSLDEMMVTKVNTDMNEAAPLPPGNFRPAAPKSLENDSKHEVSLL